jgi:hypothetical protein
MDPDKPGVFARNAFDVSRKGAIENRKAAETLQFDVGQALACRLYNDKLKFVLHSLAN